MQIYGMEAHNSSDASNSWDGSSGEFSYSRDSMNSGDTRNRSTQGTEGMSTRFGRQATVAMPSTRVIPEKGLTAAVIGKSETARMLAKFGSQQQ